MAQHSAQYKPVSAPKPRRKNTELLPWGWFDVALISATLVIASGLTAVIYSNRLTTLLPEIGKVGARVALLLVFYVAELVVLSYLAHRRERPFAEVYRLKKSDEVQPVATERGKDPLSTRGSILLTCGVAISLRLCGIAYNALMASFGLLAPSSESMTALFSPTPMGLVSAIISVAVCAPLIEELVFRVIMQEAFAHVMPLWAAIGVQAVVFSMYHLSLWAALPNLLLALCAGWLATRCRTIIPAICLHVSYNAIVITAAFYLAFTQS